MNRQKSFQSDKPTLFIVATPIGNLEEMTVRAVNTLRDVDVIAAEDTRNTVKLLNYFSIKTKLMSYHEHNAQSSGKKIIELLEEGKNVALVSDAGYPAISDPGYEIVVEASSLGYNVVPISGPSAVLNALVVSGINPQPFLFYGFLDHENKNKKKQLELLKKYKETLVIYESPYRIKKTLTIMLEILGDRKISLSREMTKLHEEVIRGNISEVLEIVDELIGEMVLVIEGNQQDEVIDTAYNLTVKDQVTLYVEEGMSTKDAIKRVADERNISKNDVYSEVHSK